MYRINCISVPYFSISWKWLGDRNDRRLLLEAAAQDECKTFREILNAQSKSGLLPILVPFSLRSQVFQVLKEGFLKVQH